MLHPPSRLRLKLSATTGLRGRPLPFPKRVLSLPVKRRISPSSLCSTETGPASCSGRRKCSSTRRPARPCPTAATRSVSTSSPRKSTTAVARNAGRPSGAFTPSRSGGTSSAGGRRPGRCRAALSPAPQRRVAVGGAGTSPPPPCLCRLQTLSPPAGILGTPRTQTRGAHLDPGGAERRQGTISFKSR